MPFKNIAAGIYRRLHDLPATPKGVLNLGDLLKKSRYQNESVIRALCSNAYLGDYTSLSRVLGRYNMFVDTRDIGFSSHMLLSGYWEMWVTEALVQRVHSGMRVVDCGANLGYFSLLMADLIGSTGHLDAFEPNPEIADRLTKSIDLNGFAARTTIHRAALSDVEGETTLFMPDGEPKNAYMNDDPTPRACSSSAVVSTTRLDSLKGATEIDFIKIDVEGAEERVWAGMTGILEKPRPLTVVLEFTPGRYSNPSDFVDSLTHYGFRVELIDVEHGVIPTTKAEILAAPPTIDQMLILSR